MIDISMPITEAIQVYKNKPEKKPKVTAIATHDKNGMHESEIHMNLHTGTHVDAPLHMIENGKTIADLPIEKMVTRARVVDVSKVTGGITQQDLEDKGIQKDDFVLLKTQNSFTESFDFEFIYVERTGAAYLAELGIKGVGIDGLGIERAQSDYATHRTLLGADIPIIEGLRLKDVAEGEYILVALPISIPEAEAAPVRAVLLEKGEVL